MLQKSKVASVRIFGEITKREPVNDSDNLSRATEVAYEFCVRRRGPSDLYTETAPAALRIFDTFGKTTFATLSPRKQTSMGRHGALLTNEQDVHLFERLAFLSRREV